MKFPWQKKQRKQNVLIATEDQRLVEDYLPVEKGFFWDEERKEAWGLFLDELIRKRGENQLFAVISERDAAPIPLFNSSSNNRKKIKDIASDIADNACDAELYKLIEKANINKIAQGIKFVFISLGITISLVVMYALLSTGKLQIPDYFMNFF
jgi:ABC-type uncharacterized transport system fused permease/ATPase subunit